jgi:hypothetical protein
VAALLARLAGTSSVTATLPYGDVHSLTTMQMPSASWTLIGPETACSPAFRAWWRSRYVRFSTQGWASLPQVRHHRSNSPL